MEKAQVVIVLNNCLSIISSEGFLGTVVQGWFKAHLSLPPKTSHDGL
jgi:hypothetical protein